jgi:hypothetical protein
MKFLIVTFLFLTSFTICGQRKYIGYMVSTGGTLSSTKFTNLGDFPLMTQPISLEKPKQFSIPIANGSEALLSTIGAKFGLQYQKSFIELLFAPLYSYNFGFTGTMPKPSGYGVDGISIDYRCISSDFKIHYKRLLTGNKKIRLSGVIGAAAMYTHYYKTLSDDGREVNKYILFDIEKKFYHSLIIGVEHTWMSNKDVAQTLTFTYQNQITPFNDNLKLSYFNLTLSQFLFLPSKETIFIYE